MKKVNKGKKVQKVNVLDNLGLVRWVLQKRFAWALRRHVGEDLFQQGVIGLIMAVKRFDKTKGKGHFQPFAIWYIADYIRQGIRQYGMDKDLKYPPPVIYSLDEARDLDGNAVEAEHKEDDLALTANRVKSLLSTLEGKVRPNDIALLKERYGLTGHKPRTLSYLSNKYSMPNAKVNKVIKKCLKYLKKVKINVFA